jgi:hypothetical protein
MRIVENAAMPEREPRVFALARGMEGARNTSRGPLFLEELRSIASENQTRVYMECRGLASGDTF